jgi:predicted nucleic acid-binding protein
MRLLIDSTVLVDYLRGNSSAFEFIRKLEFKPYISAITVAELYRGVREELKLQTLEKVLSGFEIVLIDDLIAEKGGLFCRQYIRSHGTELADALIAACANNVSAKLVTHNRKHFPMLTDVIVPY